MKNGLVIACLWMMFLSCNSKNSTPIGIMNVEKMQTILWDLARVDEYLSNYPVNDSLVSNEKQKLIRYNQVLKFNKTNEKDFKKSIRYYENNPQLLKVVFDSLAVMDQREARLKLKNSKKSIDSASRKLQ